MTLKGIGEMRQQASPFSEEGFNPTSHILSCQLEKKAAFQCL